MTRVDRILLVGAICLFAFQEEAPGFFHKKRNQEPDRQYYFRKFGIEKPENSTLAPDLTLEDLSGKRISLKSLKGRVVCLNFWATWCIPCRQEMPSMEKLHRELKEQGLEVIAVNFREDQSEVRKFVEELGLTFTILLDKDGKVFEQYGAWALPLSHFINRKGEFVGKVAGYRKWDGAEAKAFFRELLAEKP